MDILPWIAPATSVVSAITAAVAVASSWRNRGAIQAVHVDINSRMSELLALTAKSSRAEGVAAGVAASIPDVVTPPG